MNHDDPTPDMHAPSEGQLQIDALLDGEAVDKEALRSALERQDARDYLIDALLLRQFTEDMGPTRFVAPGMPRGPWARSVRWMAACAMLAVGAGGGYAYGERVRPPTRPPSSFEVSVDATPAPSAPQPTHVIRFEPGVNWSSTPEGN